jgi:histone chaperone ASF1
VVVVAMASKVILDNISVKNNPALFQDNIELDITFTAVDAIPSLLEWRIIYVGSAKNEDFDQVLEEF